MESFILRMEIANFMTYKGSTTLEFGSPKGTTLVYGVDPAGKTTIVYAFRWCLYGILPGQNSSPNRQLLNNSTLSELHDHETATAYVKIIIQTPRRIIELCRRASFQKNASQLVQGPDELLVDSQQDPFIFEAIVNYLFPKNYADFFLLTDICLLPNPVELFRYCNLSSFSDTNLNNIQKWCNLFFHKAFLQTGNITICVNKNKDCRFYLDGVDIECMPKSVAIMCAFSFVGAYCRALKYHNSNLAFPLFFDRLWFDIQFSLIEKGLSIIADQIKQFVILCNINDIPANHSLAIDAGGVYLIERDRYDLSSSIRKVDDLASLQ